MRMEAEHERGEPQAEADVRLWHGLQNCHRMVADYRERLKRYAGPNHAAEPDELDPDVKDASRMEEVSDEPRRPD